MGMMPPLFRPPGQRTKREREQDFDRKRGSARSRGYSRRWEKARATHLSHSPLCLYCQLSEGRDEAADTVDHLYPHEGDSKVFWLTELWVSCCALCHSGFKQTTERRGRAAIDQLAKDLGLPTLDQMLANRAAGHRPRRG